MTGSQSGSGREPLLFIMELVRSHPVPVFIFLTCLFLSGSSLFVSYRRAEGVSMLPTFSPGSILVCTKEAEPEKITHGACVIADASFYEDGLVVIKRVVGCPGDIVQVKDGLLYLNGEAVDDGFPQMEEPGTAAGAVMLGEDEYFLLGDNRNFSVDSREFGPVRAACITNIVIFSFF